MKLTLPQMIMLNHAAWVEYENTQKKFEHKKNKASETDPDLDPLIAEGGTKRLSDLEKDPDALDKYFAELGKIGF